MPSKPKKTKISQNHRKLGKVRIIAGKYRGRKLDVINAEGVRPSTDRIRETLFNWLMHNTSGANVLDMFAGSGVLGLESLSRGAAKATFVEYNKAGFEILKRNVEQLNENSALLIHDNAIARIPLIHDKFSIVFIDPPFRANLAQEAIDTIIENKVLTEDALVYVEHEPELALKLPAKLSLKKQIKTSGLVANLFFIESD